MQVSRTLSRVLAAAVIGAGVLLTGCASVTQPTEMVADKFDVARKHDGKVAVTGSSLLDVNGQTPMAQVSGAGLQDAVIAAINQSKVFSQVVSKDGAEYLLTAQLISNDVPAFGITFTAKCEIAWTLSKKDGTSVWRAALKSEGTATGGEAFAGVERARLARTRAVKDNISQAIKAIGAAEF